uniref:EF-hand domain-containing protein n=1 Tax=Anopheles epiroticus TaxID=199890 RepID=A0A182PEQ6_9DIPT
MFAKTHPQSNPAQLSHEAVRTVLIRVMASRRSNNRFTKPGNSTRKRGSSNVFTSLEQHQIAELRELFNLLDTNRSGVIEREDLRAMLTIWNDAAPTEEKLDEMLAETHELPLNFTLFLTMFAQKLRGTDPPEVMLSAFQCFDTHQDGTVDPAELRHWLTTQGDHRLTDEQVNEIFGRLTTLENGRLRYTNFVKLLHNC